MRRGAKKEAMLLITALRKSFSRQEFIRVLNESGLESSILKQSKLGQDIIAICRGEVNVKSE